MIVGEELVHFWIVPALFVLVKRIPKYKNKYIKNVNNNCVSALWLHKYRKCVEWLPEFLLLLIGVFFFFFLFPFLQPGGITGGFRHRPEQRSFPLLLTQSCYCSRTSGDSTHTPVTCTHTCTRWMLYISLLQNNPVLVKWRMQLIKNATMQIACCWVKRYFLFFFYLKGSVIKDCTLCVGGTDGVSQGVLVTSLHVESVQNLCIFFHILPFLPPSLRSTDSKQSLYGRGLEGHGKLFVFIPWYK